MAGGVDEVKYVGTVSTNLFNALEEAFEEYKESLGKAQEKAIKKKIKNSPERQFHRQNKKFHTLLPSQS